MKNIILNIVLDVNCTDVAGFGIVFKLERKAIVNKLSGIYEKINYKYI